MQQSSSVHMFLKGIILFGFGMLILGLITTGNIIYYIAPHMMPFIYFAVVVFLLLSVTQIMQSMQQSKLEAEGSCEHNDHGDNYDCDGHHHMPSSPWKKSVIYVIFLIPLLAGFLLPDQALDSSVAQMRGVQLGGGVYSNQVFAAGGSIQGTDQVQEIQEIEEVDDSQAQSNSSNSKTSDDYLAELDRALNPEEDGSQGANVVAGSTDIDASGLESVEHIAYDELLSEIDYDDYYGGMLQEALSAEMIVIDDDNFLDMMMVVDMHLDQLKGKTIQMIGFVYREEGIADDEMVVARFSMTCCTADSAVYGLLVRGDETSQYEMDEWVQVRGTITKTFFGDWQIPGIDITEIQVIEAPDSPYVYPSFIW